MSVFRSERRARRGGPFRGWCGSRWPKPGTVSRNRPQESAGTARIDAKTGCPAPETVGYFRSAEIGDQPAAQGQWDLLARGERRGDAGAACRGVDGPVGGDDGTGAGHDGDGPPSALTVEGPGHRGGVELGCTDQAASVAT